MALSDDFGLFKKFSACYCGNKRGIFIVNSLGVGPFYLIIVGMSSIPFWIVAIRKVNMLWERHVI